jgi:protein gp37
MVRTAHRLRKQHERPLPARGSDAYIEDVVRVMVEANWHTYQVLTKRSDRLAHLLSTSLRFAASYSHIWWGVSVEDRKYGLPRITHLREAPAAMRFLSIEPLLEDLGVFDLSGIHWAIVGGESGHGARTMEPEWVENIYRICIKQQVRFFFKQWGGVHKSKTGRLLHGRTYDDMPERIVAAIPNRKDRLVAAQPYESKASRWQSFTSIGNQMMACS